MVNKIFKLVFFHFSSLNLNNVDSLAKGQNRFTTRTRSDIKYIFEEYAKSFETARKVYNPGIICFYTRKSFFDKLRYYWNRYRLRKKLAI